VKGEEVAEKEEEMKLEIKSLPTSKFHLREVSPFVVPTNPGELIYHFSSFHNQSDAERM
jgi:hypothetical protein